MKKPDDRQQIQPKDAAAWRDWLERNHADASGVWIVYPKKGTGRRKLDWAEAVEEALCFGWIDGKVNPIDDEHYRQLFTPRKPKGTWSKINKDKVIKLIADKRMTPAGLAAIERAKANGSWTQLDSVEAMEVPDDLQRALDNDPKAKQNYEAFSMSARKAILYRINAAKRAETRSRRIEKAVKMTAEGVRPSDYSP